MIPHDMYTIKVLENIDASIVSTHFRCNRMKKIESNIHIISNMFFEENNDIRYVSKWIRMSVKLFITSINKYYKWNFDSDKQKSEKDNEKLNRLLNIKGLIQIYMGLNRGKCINTKGILNFIKPCNL